MGGPRLLKRQSVSDLFRPVKPRAWSAWVLLLSVILAAAPSCTASQAPDPLPILHLHGTPRERGLQHGRQMSSQIKSFYTTMLAISLLPYLNRQQPDIAAYLKAYDPAKNPAYANGQFSLQLLTESALELEKSLPAEIVEELHGIADGAGVPYQQVLLLNTFVDSVMSARAVTQYLQQIQAPRVVELSLAAAASATVDSDGIDNDEDGTTDEPAEGTMPYAPRPTATLRELPVTTAFRFLLKDTDGIAPASVRVHLVANGKLQIFTTADKALAIAPSVTGPKATASDPLEVVFTPPEPLPPAAVVTVAIQASDTTLVVNPPPSKARTMRIEQITFSTLGYGKPLADIANLGKSDGTSQPTSLAFALRKSATADGLTRLAMHFSLLDAGTSHKHCVVQVHEPKDGPAFAFAGWAGIAFGFVGLSARGVSVAATHADTLNNPLVDQVKKKFLSAKLIDSGLPVGFGLRRVLQEAHSAKEGAELLRDAPQSFGWNFVIADAAGGIQAVEALSGIAPEFPHTVTYEAGAVDAKNRQISSVGPDDILTTVHYRALADDFAAKVLVFDLQPQRFWDTYWYSSLRTWHALAGVIQSDYGKLDTTGLIALLRRPELVDPHDSMQAAVAEPGKLRLWVAAGQVPATDGAFVHVDLPPWGGL